MLFVILLNLFLSALNGYMYFMRGGGWISLFVSGFCAGIAVITLIDELM